MTRFLPSLRLRDASFALEMPCSCTKTCEAGRQSASLADDCASGLASGLAGWKLCCESNLVVSAAVVELGLQMVAEAVNGLAELDSRVLPWTPQLRECELGELIAMCCIVRLPCPAEDPRQGERWVQGSGGALEKW